MAAIRISTTIPESRTLVIQLPSDTPTGPAELEIRPNAAEPLLSSTNPAREAARAKLLAAGALCTYVDVPEDAVPLTLEERMQIGKMPPGARPSEELIDEDRGER